MKKKLKDSQAATARSVIETHLNAQQKPFVLILCFLVALLVPFQSIDFLLQALDVVNGRLEYGALVRSHVAHKFIVGFIVLRQQRAQLFNAIINVESTAPLDWKVDR